MFERLSELEKASRQLEPDYVKRKEVRNKVIAYSERFLKRIEKLKAYQLDEEKGIRLLDYPIREEGIPIDEALQIIEKNVDTPGLNPASGGHLGYIPGGGIYYSALGDYLADVTNRYAGVFFAGPGAVRMENMLIRWTAELFGYPSTASGNLASGGSIANLMAIVTARDAKKINSSNLTSSVIYCTSHVHHCIDKAIRIAGLSECIVRPIAMDSKYRMDVEALNKQISLDKTAGLNPFLLIASAGTTDVGAVDPLDRLGDIAKRENLWYHIDAAYGGFFILTETAKNKFKGIEKSDSLVADPHKGLFLPYGLGIVLIKNKTFLQNSHYYMANYMQDAASSTDEDSPAELSPELTKHFRGMRLWLPLMLHGLKPFRECLEEKLLLTQYFNEEIKKLGFETCTDPELSVATYRYITKKTDPNIFNKKLIEAVQKEGSVFISSTMLDGKFTLRLACLAFRTHKSTIEMLLKVLKKKVKEVKNELK